MTPYYQDDAVTIYHGDSREILPRIGRVDHVITDPPYSEETHKGARTRTTGANSEKLITFDSISPQSLRELLGMVDVRRWVVGTMEWRHVAFLEAKPPEGLRFVRFGVWVKPNGAPQLTGDRPAQGWEAVGMLHKDTEAMRWNGGGKRAVWNDLVVNATHHPTEKPTSLLTSFISLFTDAGEAILDPFMGSGTTLRAAKDLGRKAIGIEMNEQHCETAARRMAQEVFAF